MNIYTNGFNFSFQDSGDEVIIQFLQRSPSFDDKGAIINIDVEKVASVVMSKQLATALRDMLSNMPNEEEASEVASELEKD